MKQQLIDAKAELDEANGQAQSAINSLSGIIPEPTYKQFTDVLKELQPESMGGTRGPGILNALSAQLQTLIDATPDDAGQ
jgi:hypothetical protein